MGAYLSLSGSRREVGWGGGGHLFEAGHLLTFFAFRMCAYSRWALIRGWGLIRINTVFQLSEFWNTSLLFDSNYKYINGMRFSLSVSRACLVICKSARPVTN